MQYQEEIIALIPHRPPFLWVDKIVSCTDDLILTEKHIPDNLEVLKGHYPGNPIMPGVLLCEAVFQSAVLLMAKMNVASFSEGQIPVLTRISSAKFKRVVIPGDTARIEVKLLESVSTACYFKGVLKVEGKTAIIVEFACKMVSSEP
jgi:3-hydroxyacyl-[acyl-carrier-protein] dehydratase